MANQIVYEVHYVDAAQSFSCIAVWEALRVLKNQHYAGPTVEEIVTHTKLPVESVQKALAALGGMDPEKGCLQMKYCQEGTAGPFATRFSQRSNVVPEFVFRNHDDNNYKIKLK